MDKIVILCMILGTFTVPVLSNITETTFTSYNNSNSTLTPPSQTSTSVSSFETQTSTVPATSTTSLTPEQECEKLSGSCDSCVKNGKCLYCYTNDTCQLYPSGKVLPSSDDCALSEARWGVCWLNFEAMIISVSVIGGVIVLTITFCCIYCCCCRTRGRKQQELEDKKFESKKMERRAMQDDRRAERKGRVDEIRKKYGLMKDDNPYQQFES